MYGRSEGGQYTVEANEGIDLTDALRDAIGLLPSVEARERKTEAGELVADERESAAKLYASMTDKVGNYVIADERVHVVSAQDQELIPPPWHRGDMKLPRGFDVGRADALAKDFVGLRDILKRQIAIDLNPAAAQVDSDEQRARLRVAYEGFVAKWGSLNASPAIDRLLGGDPEWGAVLALENVRREVREGKTVDVAVPAKILSERTLFPVQRPQKAETVADAVLISLSEYGHVDVDYVCRLVGSDDESGVEELVLKSGLAFMDAESGIIESRERYLSGNVVRKLEAARKAAELDPERYAKNIEALEAVQPRRILFNEINCELGAPWLPLEAVSEFAASQLGQLRSFRVSYVSELNKWVVPQNWVSSPKLSEFSTHRKTAIDVFEAALNNERIRIIDRISDTVTRYNEKESNLANDRVGALRQSFQSFLRENESVQKLIEETYNEKFNHSIVPVYDGSYLALLACPRR